MAIAADEQLDGGSVTNMDHSTEGSSSQTNNWMASRRHRRTIQRRMIVVEELRDEGSSLRWTTGKWSSVTVGPFNGRTIITGEQVDDESSTLKDKSTRYHCRRGTAGQRIIVAGEQLNGGSGSLKNHSTEGSSAQRNTWNIAANGPSRRTASTKAKLYNVNIFSFSLVLSWLKVRSPCGYSWIQAVQSGGLQVQIGDHWRRTNIFYSHTCIWFVETMFKNKSDFSTRVMKFVGFEKEMSDLCTAIGLWMSFRLLTDWLSFVILRKST